MTEKNSRVVDFPLRGEWIAPHTPGDKVPSHGTDILGQRFAFDFMRSEKGSNHKFYTSPVWKYILMSIKLEECYGYNENIYSPVNGTILTAVDGQKEPKRLHLPVDLLKVLWNSVSSTIQSLYKPLEEINLGKFLGNYVIIEFEGIYALFAHMRPGSIVVKEGQAINKGDMIGRIGHTGNSTAPHLHFQLMDSADLWKAKGIPCVFNEYEILVHEKWESVSGDIPHKNQRIRFNKKEL